MIKYQRARQQHMSTEHTRCNHSAPLTTEESARYLADFPHLWYLIQHFPQNTPEDCTFLRQFIEYINHQVTTLAQSIQERRTIRSFVKRLFQASSPSSSVFWSLLYPDEATCCAFMARDDARQFLTTIFRELYPYRDHFGFAMATLACFLPDAVNLLPQLKTPTTGNFILTPHNQTWFLCEEAEELLAHAYQKSLILLINDTYLVKFSGRLAAMCINSQQNTTGQVMLAGHWYSPFGDTIDKLQRWCQHPPSNSMSIKTDEPMSLAYMRPYQANNPPTLPIAALKQWSLQLAQPLPSQINQQRDPNFYFEPY